MPTLEDEFRDISTQYAGNAIYQAGVIAWRNKQPDTECPYPSFKSASGATSDSQRKIWMSGYYDARIFRLLTKCSSEVKGDES